MSLEITPDQFTPELMEQAKELTKQFALIAKDYPANVRLLVLESVLGAEYGNYASVLAPLFDEMLGEFKHRASMLLTVAELIKDKLSAIQSGVPTEEILRQIKEEHPELAPQEPASTPTE